MSKKPQRPQHQGLPQEDGGRGPRAYRVAPEACAAMWRKTPELWVAQYTQDDECHRCGFHTSGFQIAPQWCQERKKRWRTRGSQALGPLP